MLFTLSGVFCIAMPVRVLELFQETLQGGSDMSPRAAGMQYRLAEEEKTKDKWLAVKRLVLLTTGARLCMFVSQLLIFFCGV